MVVQGPKVVHSAEEFDELLRQSDLGDGIYEYIGGEVVEVPSNPYASEIGGTLFFFLKLFVRENHIEGHVTPADGGYWIAGERYAPDVAYISKARQAELARSGYNPNPPELAVEVVSDENSSKELNTLRWKITNYLAVGTVVWVVFPISLRIEIHAPGKSVQQLDINSTLDGGDLLPGFTLLVNEIFKTA